MFQKSLDKRPSSCFYSLDGKQIVPAEWVEQSLTHYTGFVGQNRGDLHNFNYGYLWWLGEIKDHQVFLALGYGGQFNLNIPDLNRLLSPQPIGSWIGLQQISTKELY